MFDRVVCIDWSGASQDDKKVDLRVVGSAKGVVTLVQRGKGRSWSRAECRSFLSDSLRPQQPRTLVALDFGLGLPWGSDQAMFDCIGWRALTEQIAAAYATCGTARSTAEQVNDAPRFAGHGPFRFNHSRTDYRFYLDHGVSYYRLVDQCVPQAISHWYLGSGGTVGFHTLSGLATMATLLRQRDEGSIDFQVWPQEGMQPDPSRHVIAEIYPAVFPLSPELPAGLDDHERDAWRAAVAIADANSTGALSGWFDIRPPVFGRVEGVPAEDQLAFEGWILGVR